MKPQLWITGECRRYSAGVKLVPLLMALAVGAAPLAHADDNDTAYEVAIQSVDVPASSPAAATVYGRDLCNRISKIGFDPLVGVVHQENGAAGVTMHQSALVIGAAISNYCIDKFGLLPKTLTY